ncbi:MAG TPA: protease pro-enzyme activation domain-containing protein, partial [Chloroflexota bacterium]|nr:protease pro-enzyme activation domain-containing protein [Chloroflexota bacterium]
MSTLVGPASPTQSLQLTFFLKPRNVQQLKAAAQQALQTHQATLSKQDFLSQNAPNWSDYDALAAFVQVPGVTIDRTSADRTTLQVTAPVSVAEALLGIQVNVYSINGHQFYANATNPLLPAELASKMTHISGLDDAAPFHRSSGAPRPAPFTAAPLPGSWLALGAGPAPHGQPAPLPGAGPNLPAAQARVQPWPKPKPQAIGAAGASPYAPSDIQAAYDELPLLNAGFDGTGQTIGIVTLADYSLTAVRQFESVFGLPQAAITQVGSAPYSADGCNAGGMTESNLDVEWAQAMAPQASIKVFEAPGCDLASAINAAVSDGSAKFVSISWGSCEPLNTPSQVAAIDTALATGVANGMQFFVASGDQGGEACLPFFGGPAVDFPASDPNVTAVGGTALALASLEPPSQAPGLYVGESAWPNSGGGCSTLFGEPSWQSAYRTATGATSPCPTSFGGSSGRAVPDVAANAAEPYAVFDSSGFDFITGTSVAAPVWAGLVAAMQTSSTASGVSRYTTRYTPELLYQSSRVQGGGPLGLPEDVHDVTSGSNLDNSFSAGTRWDALTGLGSPDVAALLTKELGGSLGVPSNDSFAGALPVTLPALAELSTAAATTEASETSATTGTGGNSACGPVAHTVWYKITTDPNATSVNLFSAGTFSGSLALWSGTSLSSLTEVVCIPRAGLIYAIGLPSPGGSQTLYIQAAGSGGDSGGLEFSITQSCSPACTNATAAPANDNLANAQALTVPSTVQGNNIAATTESGEPLSCTDVSGYTVPYSATVWYKFTPAVNETLVLGGSPMIEAVWSGPSAAPAYSQLTPVSCSFSDIPTPVVLTSGITYYFQLGAFFLREGAFQFAVSAVQAGATFNVNTTSDLTSGFTGACAAGTAGQCSFREAVIEASLPGLTAVTLNIPGGTYLLNGFFGPLLLGTTGVYFDAPGPSNATVAINGAGAASTVIDSQHVMGVLGLYGVTATLSGVTVQNGATSYGGSMFVAPGAHVTISNSTLSGGIADPGPGGGLFNMGILTLNSVTVSANASAYEGGGIYNVYGTGLTVNSGTFSGNSAQFGGGAIAVVGAVSFGSSLTSISGTTFSGNSAPGSGGMGGALDFGGFGNVSIGGSTFTGNSASAGGGAISNWGSAMTLASSSVTGNAASGPGAVGGGIYNSGGLTVQASTIAGNTVSGATGQGAGFYNDNGSLTITNSTMFGNASNGTSGIGGLYNRGGSTTVSYSTIAGNDLGLVADPGTPGSFTLAGTIVSQAPGGLGADCTGTSGHLTDQGYNLADDASCGFSASTS